MLFKRLEFKNKIGQKVEIVEIPYLLPGNPHYFMVQARLNCYIDQIFEMKDYKRVYSFKHYLAAVLKWPVYYELFEQEFLNNA
ncbi:DUF2535 family protein [Bacillus massiliglaciei]|uniref:DUF2535 family protein n=1 Tax=Bacillus massiliglaciei TaxID=1816693 RepID=UPI000DA61A34|nr:DUF2535 family protein [Bacillus massiliglaciei]